MHIDTFERLVGASGRPQHRAESTYDDAAAAIKLETERKSLNEFRCPLDSSEWPLSETTTKCKMRISRSNANAVAAWMGRVSR